MDKGQQLRDVCSGGLLDEAKQLVDEGVDVDSKGGIGWTPLMFAAMNGNVDIVRFLLDRGANADTKDDDGDTALSYAAINGNDEAARLLIERGANMHTKNNDGDTPLSDAKYNNHSSTAAIIEAAMKSTKVIHISSEYLQRNNTITFKDFHNNIIILTDNNIPDGFEFEGHPVITLQNIQQCIDQLHVLRLHNDNESNDISTNDIQTLLAQRHPTISTRLQHWEMNLLHLIAYFPQERANDIYQYLLSSLLIKCPKTATSVDIDGMTPLHHAIINLSRKKICQECHDLLLKGSPPAIVHRAIKAGMTWHHLRNIVMAKLDALTMEDEESSLLPFMLAAERCKDDSDGSLSMAYELLCLQPDVLKEYDELNMRKRVQDESSISSSDQIAKRVRGA